MSEAHVAVGVPVYRSAAIVGDTLTSIRAQTHENFTAIVSVDGADAESLEACRHHAGSDSRFILHQQPERLGWAGNINFTMQHALATNGATHYCYWQHDDINAPTYFEKLLALPASSRAIVYSDLVWFGDREGIEAHPPISGFAIERVMSHIEAILWVPFRGLVPLDVLAKAGKLRSNEYESIYEDVVWLAHAARECDFVRLPEVLVRKRYGKGSTHVRQLADHDDARRRGATIAIAAGFIAAAWPLVTREDDGWRALYRILSRMLGRGPNQLPYFAPASRTPDAIAAFARDVISRVQSEALVDLTKPLGHNWDRIQAQCAAHTLAAGLADG